MVRERLQAGIEAMKAPDERSEQELIWEVIRSWLVIGRVLVLLLMIFLAEFTEEYFFAGMSVSVWVIIIGIPSIIILSIIIIWGDKSFEYAKKKRDERMEYEATTEGRAYLKPIHERK